MSLKSPFARLFAAKTRSAEEGEDDVTKRKQKDGEGEVADPDDLEDLKDPEDDDDSEEAKKARKAKKAKKAAADGDDDTDEEDDKDATKKAARARERGRIGAIMSSDAAMANPVAALRMAVHTNMSRNAAIATLRDIGPASRSTSGRDRLMTVNVPDVGSNDTAVPSGSRATAEAIILAGRRRRGET